MPPVAVAVAEPVAVPLQIGLVGTTLTATAVGCCTLAVAVAAQWISNYLVSWTFPMMDKSSFLNSIFHQGFSYWIYGIMSLLAAWFVWKLVPETRNKTLEEMERLWK